MASEQPHNLTHGVTLEAMLRRLVEDYGWEKLGGWIKVRCFNHDPSIKSSLAFLRKTPWAREKVEHLYVRHMEQKQPPSMRRSIFDFDPE